MLIFGMLFAFLFTSILDAETAYERSVIPEADVIYTERTERSPESDHGIPPKAILETFMTKFNKEGKSNPEENRVTLQREYPVRTGEAWELTFPESWSYHMDWWGRRRRHIGMKKDFGLGRPKWT